MRLVKGDFLEEVVLPTLMKDGTYRELETETTAPLVKLIPFDQNIENKHGSKKEGQGQEDSPAKGTGPTLK